MNQIEARSGPAVIPDGKEPLVGTANSVIAPLVVMRPILPANVSVNHNAPSGPAVIPNKPALPVGTKYSVTAQAVVLRPILLVPCSTNHRAPSDPEAISEGFAPVTRRPIP